MKWFALAALAVAALWCAEAEAGCRQSLVLRQRGFAVVQPVRQDAIVLRRGLFGGVRAQRVRNAQILVPSRSVFSQGTRLRSINALQVGGCRGGRCAVFFR